MENARQIQDFCRRYFHAVDAPILVDQEDFLQVELPREIDKELIERRYYWMYIEATNQNPPNTVLSMSFRPDLEIEGVDKMDFVTLGSFLLNKIIESTQKRGRFTRAYQKVTMPGTRLQPMLLTTFKLSFVADRRRDEMVSYGVDLLTGRVVRDFYEQVEKLPFQAAPSEFTPPVEPKYTVDQGYQKIREALQAEIEALDHTWAEEADEHLKREIEQLETYYDSLTLVSNSEAKNPEEQSKKASAYAAERELRLAELKWRCAPRVQIEPFHVGLLYVVNQ